MTELQNVFTRMDDHINTKGDGRIKDLEIMFNRFNGSVDGDDEYWGELSGRNSVDGLLRDVTEK